jgi:predicted XRE-type DNA-binding protein
LKKLNLRRRSDFSTTDVICFLMLLDGIDLMPKKIAEGLSFFAIEMACPSKDQNLVRNIASTKSVIDFIVQLEKEAKKGTIPQLLPENANLEERMKYSLCKLFVQYVIKKKLKAVELASLLKLPKTRISDILNYKTSSYTVDRLLSYARKLSEVDAPTKEHLHLMFEILSGPVRPVRITKKMEKELQKYA